MSLQVDDAQFEAMWKNSGVVSDGGRITMDDALGVPNAAALIPKVMSGVVKEAQEPLLIGTALLQRINYSQGITITMPALGAIVADDMAEGEEYPEHSPSMGGATQTVTIGKVGTSFKVTEEMVRFNQFDMVGALLRAAGRALARHKEQKIFNLIRNMGVCVFNNSVPGSSLMGVTHGRSMAGVANGSLVADDLFDAWAFMMMQGHFCDTILVHPLAWPMFVKDATLRAFVMQNGGGTMFASWAGNPKSNATGMGGVAGASGQDINPPGNPGNGLTATGTPGYFPNQLTSAPVLPGYMNLPLRIIVSPFMPFDASRRLTDIFMCDSSSLGALIVDHDVMVEDWTDPRNDIKKVKLKERYSVALFENGQGACTLKNISIKPNEVVLPAQATIGVESSTLGPIDPAGPVTF